MSHISRLLQQGIPVICKRPPLLETPKKLYMSEEELKYMIPVHIVRTIQKEKRDFAAQKAKEEVAAMQSDQVDILQKTIKLPKTIPETVETPPIYNIKLSDKIHASLVQLLSSGKLKDPLLLASDLHICKVTLSHSRSKAIVQWSLLGEKDPARVAAIDDALDKNRKHIGHLIGQQVQTRFMPSYLFEYKEDPFN